MISYGRFDLRFGGQTDERDLGGAAQQEEQIAERIAEPSTVRNFQLGSGRNVGESL